MRKLHGEIAPALGGGAQCRGITEHFGQGHNGGDDLAVGLG